MGTPSVNVIGSDIETALRQVDSVQSVSSLLVFIVPLSVSDRLFPSTTTNTSGDEKLCVSAKKS